MKESLLYKKLPNQQVQCQTCSHYCLIKPEQWGQCQVRQNQQGRLYFALWGQPCSINIDPIEKKPFFHFLPGSQTLSLATAGCNFQCQNCQNWNISQITSKRIRPSSSEVKPEQIIYFAQKENLPSISYTYTEPTVFLEYAWDIMMLAHSSSLKNLWVSNGFFSLETFNLISPFLDAINIDFKGFSEDFYQKNCGGRLQPILDNLLRIKQAGIWLEITTLIIPGLNDSQDSLLAMARFIKDKLGTQTPWHLSSFAPSISWKLPHLPPTNPNFIEEIQTASRQIGLQFVYAGNLPHSTLENTYCPQCGQLMIERDGYQIKRFDRQGKCSSCNCHLIIQE